MTGKGIMNCQSDWVKKTHAEKLMANGNNSENIVDDLDFAILAHLQEDGRRSFTDIAKDLGTAVGTIRNRVTKLLEDNTLKIIGRVNPFRVGFNSPASILIAVEPQFIQPAATEISKFPEVSYISMLTGEFDLMVDAMCRDSDHLTNFLLERLSKVEGVKSYRVAIILRIVKVAQPDLLLAKERSPSVEHELSLR
jgi:Lrp/AsnC family transcriptional regulator, regulator for asnA, asnC and gidA